MKYYFQLQYKRIARWLKEMGVHPVIGIVAAIGLFIVGSFYVFFKIEIAAWVYAGIALLVVGQMSLLERNEEMRRMCKGVEYKKWRLIENVGLAFPFVIYLLYEREWGVALLVLAVSAVLAFVTFRQLIFKSIPTPFKRLPFELIIGFRRTVILFLVMLFVMMKAIQVDNFNLGLVLLVATYLIQMSYYLITENDYFVWIFSLNRKTFLLKKWITSQSGAAIISIPFAILLAVFFPEKILFVLTAIVLGHIWITTAVFCKYATFPKEMNVAQAFIFAGAIILFPFLIFLIPFYIRKANSSLELYLK